MSKKTKIIIGIMGGVILILLSLVIFLLVKVIGFEKDKRDIVKTTAGIYYAQSYKYAKNVTLRLKDDMTCEHPIWKNPCKWSISEGEITLKLTTYEPTYDKKVNNNIIILGEIYYTKEECDNYVKNYSDKYVNLRCKKKIKEEKALILNYGVLLNGEILNRVK